LITPNDIENISERFITAFNENRDSDIIKKIKLKDFKLPPILPIVFYEGIGN